MIHLKDSPNYKSINNDIDNIHITILTVQRIKTRMTTLWTVSIELDSAAISAVNCGFCSDKILSF